MFENCETLTHLDVSNFDTSHVINFEHMFAGCSSLTSLDLNNFNTPSMVRMSYLFFDCNSLTHLDISNFDTSHVTSMSCIFDGCSSLTYLDISNFDTSNVTSMSSMFRDCTSLTRLDLSNFDTSQVTDMNSMFRNCNSLEYLNVSNFDTSAAINKLKSERICWTGTCYSIFDLRKNQSRTFTIVLGPKCYTYSDIYEKQVVKLGIQYILPYINRSDKQKYIIKQEKNNRQFDYYYYNNQYKYNTDCAENSFGDVWSPEMAGTWTIMPVETKITQYTVTFKDGLDKSVISSSKVNEGSKIDAPTPPNHDGYEFVEWQNGDKLTNVQSDVTVTAIYRKIEKPVTKYTVTFKDGLTNSVISSSTVEAGASVSVPSAPSHDGYRFISWLNQNRLTNIQSDVVVTAQYEKIIVPVKHYKVTFIDSVTNKVIIEKDAKEGDTVFAPEAPRHDGYSFVEWSNKDKMINVRSDCKVTAVYREIKQTNDNSNQSNNSNNSDNANSNAGNVKGNANIAANSNSDSYVEVNASNVNATNNNQMINDNQAENLIQTGINQFYILIATFAAILISFVAYRYRIDK